MIKAYLSNVSKSKSLTVKIKEAEQQLLIRQRRVSVSADTLIKNIHRQMTAPSTLLLTVGIGFIIGELTRRRTSGNPSVSSSQRPAGSSALRTALNLITSVHTLYMALPVAWKVRIFQATGKPGRRTPGWQAQPVSASGNRRKSRH